MRRIRAAYVAIWATNAFLIVGVLSVASMASGAPAVPDPGTVPPVPPVDAAAGMDSGGGREALTLSDVAPLWAGMEAPEPKTAPVNPNPQPKEPPKVYGTFLLTGTIVTPDTKPAAFIRYNGGADKAYMEGDFLGGWMIASIEERSVILRRGDEKATLTLGAPARLEVGKNLSPAAAFDFDGFGPGPDLDGLVLASTPPAMDAAETTRPAVSHGELTDEEAEAARRRAEDRIIPEPRDRQYDVASGTIDYMRDRLPQLKKQVRLAMHQEADGSYGGIAVHYVRPGSIWQKYGLCDGDIIRKANGKEIKTPAQVLALYHAVFSKQSNVEKLNLVVERKGKLMQRLYRMKRGPSE